VLAAGVLVAFWVGLRVYAREKILDAVKRIGKDVYFQKPWFST